MNHRTIWVSGNPRATEIDLQISGTEERERERLMARESEIDHERRRAVMSDGGGVRLSGREGLLQIVTARESEIGDERRRAVMIDGGGVRPVWP